MDEGRVDVQGAHALHHPGLTAQHLKHTAGDRKSGDRKSVGVFVYVDLNMSIKYQHDCSNWIIRARTVHLGPIIFNFIKSITKS